MSSDGWIKLHRKLQDNPLWMCEKFTRGQAWVDLLLLTNHSESFFYKRGIKVGVKRGQCARSEVELSDRWKWSRSKVKKFLNDLEKEQQIVQQKTNITQIVTIVNYEEYQKKEQQTVQQKSSRRAAERHIQESKEEKECRELLGTFKNVILSEEEENKLKEKFNGSFEDVVNKLSEYMKSKGKKYASHYATILAWDRRESRNAKTDEWGQPIQ